MGLVDRLKHAWNAFVGLDPPEQGYIPNYNVSYIGESSSYRPDRLILKRGSERSIVGAIYNKIAIDCSTIDIKHVVIDENGRYIETKDSYLNDCLTLEANKDQTSKQLIRDVVISMFDEGCIAVVPIDTIGNPNYTESYDIVTMRVGKITQWYPDHVRVECYNERTGRKAEILMKKDNVAIIENPLSAIMNEPNSILQRLIHKLGLLDIVDEQASSGKLDLIIQLPYIIKTEARRQQAEQRKQDIENQLKNSKYGIAYTDGTEHITQLNRSVENNLIKQIEYLTNMLYSQLGITADIMNGSADEKTMLNYMNRTVRPVMDAIVDEFKRKFLTKTGRSQGQTIMYFNNPFSLVTVDKIADIADKFTRNEIMSSNEIRQIIGLKPSNDPKADELRNKNIPQESQGENEVEEPQEGLVEENPRINGKTRIKDLTG